MTAKGEGRARLRLFGAAAAIFVIAAPFYANMAVAQTPMDDPLDARDAKRAVAPLAPAPDSQVLDSSALSIDEVVDRIVGWSREKKLGGSAGS